MKRVPASMRRRESLSDLIEGRLSSADGRAALVKLATRLIVEEALEAESRDALGRDYYEHGASQPSWASERMQVGTMVAALTLFLHPWLAPGCCGYAARPRN